MTRLLKVCPLILATAGVWGQQAATPRGVVFIVRHLADSNFQLEPLIEYRGGRLQAPSRTDPGTNCRTFAPEYTRAGRSYTVLFGGARAGTARVERGGKFAVSFTRPVRLPEAGGTDGSGKRQMALATDVRRLGRETGSRRAPTAEEQAAALRLVRAEYRRRGVTVPARFALEELISTDLNQDGEQDLIGAWRVDESPAGRSHSLLIVAERDGESYRLSLVKYHSGSGETYGFEEPVDHADLDGDGSDELITRAWGWEWYTNRVYSRRGAGWVRIFEGNGCEGM